MRGFIGELFRLSKIEGNKATVKLHKSNSAKGIELQHGNFHLSVTGRTGAGAIIGDNDKKGTDSSIICIHITAYQLHRRFLFFLFMEM
jgi:hypothetical protein